MPRVKQYRLGKSATGRSQSKPDNKNATRFSPASNHRIKKVLIANRAEIALRVQRACDSLGISSVITVSDTDRLAHFSKKAHEPAYIGGQSAKESYLNISSLIEAAKKHQCDAVHPGYGFLSENSDFARKVVEAGLIFIGPSADCIEALGDKAKARAIAKTCKIPTTPGSASLLDDKTLSKEARQIGYPLLIKAVAGGGGRGMRVVKNDKELKEALPLARSEAGKNFSDDRIYLEKFIEKPRHVEVQILGDNFGNVIHLGTRDCSTQRRYQKLIEEAPAPNLSTKLRNALHEAAVKIAKAVNYNSVGTAEFLVSGEKFYFLEMNTRIQVEHPVTEEITGLDLVALQIKVAQNEKLPFTQAKVKFKGHSIEFRINAEIVEENFRPTMGLISKFPEIDFPFLREERGFADGDSISPYYDSLISKLIVTGKSREDALGKSKKLLGAYEIEGISTTIPFHRWILEQKYFWECPIDIAFIGREFSGDSLKELDARNIRDPKFRTPQNGVEHSELIVYQSKKFKYNYIVEVLHRQDGTFVLIPLNKKGKRTAEKFSRRSNGFDAALKSLKDEVLEVVPPTKI